MAPSLRHPILSAIHDAEISIDREFENDQIHRKASKDLRDIRHYLVFVFLEPSNGAEHPNLKSVYIWLNLPTEYRF